MGDSSITLFIQAHGEEFKNKRFVAENKNVHLLSFPGIYGEDGKMITQEDDGTPVDIFILERLRHKYNSVDPTTERTQRDIYNRINDTLRTTYEDFGIQFDNGGFRYTNPRLERTFTFKANKGECSSLCPEYGLTIVSSFTREPGDNKISRNFTLSNINNWRTSSNLHMNEAARNFWIKKSYDSVIKNGLYPESTQFLNDIFNKMFHGSSKEIQLSELIRWCNIMGYLNIYIYDPSCRSSTDYEDNMKLALDQKRYSDVLGLAAKERWMKAFISVAEVPNKTRKKTNFPPNKTRKKYAKYPLFTSAIKPIKHYNNEENKGDDYNQEIPHGQYYTDYPYYPYLDNPVPFDNSEENNGVDANEKDYAYLANLLNEPGLELDDKDLEVYFNSKKPDPVYDTSAELKKNSKKRKPIHDERKLKLKQPKTSGGKHNKRTIIKHKKNHKTRTIRKHKKTKKRTIRKHKKSRKRITRKR